MARPRGMTVEEAFAWFMPGDPPPAPSPTEGCWDWVGSTQSAGYGLIDVGCDGGRIRVLAHRVAHEIYVGPLGKQKALHSCDRPICVQPAHLSAGTSKQNTAHMLLRGRAAVGERCGSSKLTEMDVRWLRERTVSHAEAAKKLGISKSQVKRIRRGTNWRHLLKETFGA